MKARLFLLVCWLTFPLLVKAQSVSGFVDQQIIRGSGGEDFGLNTYFFIQAKQTPESKLGLFVWAQLSPAPQLYGQGYVGPFVDIHGVQVGGGLGAERTVNKFRQACWLYTEQGPIMVNLVFEHGGSGAWYMGQVRFYNGKRFAVSVNSWAGLGFGPRLDVKVPHTPFSVYFSPLFQPNGDKSFLYTVRYSFQK